jgi:protein-S-isoprenylcysteine O-methyltransferase Ste14
MILLLKNLVFSLLVPGTVAVLGPLLISTGTVDYGSWLVLSGSILLFVGLVIYCWCVWDFAIFGRGTPAPIDAPKRLVVRGLYRFSRNPMYVGVLCIIFGWALFYTAFGVFIYGLSIAICFQLFIVFYEEPMLQQLFGVEYGEYQSTVNRWLPNCQFSSF